MDLFQSGEKIVFIGDSITDTGRREDPEGIGHGYVRLIRDYYAVTLPYLRLEVINKGISGNRVDDLAARWQEDIIELQPDWVSISIGINDVWRQLKRPEEEQIYPEQFEQIYANLLNQLVSKTEANIILMEPTVIEENGDAIGNRMLIPYIDAVHRLAKEHGAIIVPTHQAFLAFLAHQSGFPLTTDGVHMNTAGNLLMAKTWIKALQHRSR
ncbi:SGNH/GDSL hydrolase family protein [Bacillus sp. FJAT-50079]|uniref:SGNH/GDSL hydrolase family protein n=1 Tax=Bacillus sp. FJAT-50079 TaxID=2833577 RepID=UPI001BC8D673|nr:SGNH/GDSL hydrolase family protein [Bacillus sp. FJAT-50079]MBS4206971.1 SGNH/GDSL hydrolase family protein [Bacillus sp. FJAT-50079]